MKYPKCSAENRDDSKFCGNCAAPLSTGAGAGPEAASLTKTLETPLHVLKPKARPLTAWSGPRRSWRPSEWGSPCSGRRSPWSG